MGIQSIVLSLIARVNLALNTMSLPCLRRGERRRWLLVFSRYQSYRPYLCTYLSLSLKSRVNVLDVEAFIEDPRFWPTRFPFSYYFHNSFLVIERSNSCDLRKQSNEKDLKINIEILERMYSYENDNHRRQRRSGVVSMSIHPSVLFSFLDSFPSTLSSEYWLLGANGLRYRLIQMRTGFHSKLDGATVSAML